WRFFSAHADQLAEFISVAASCGWTSEGPEPEAFFRYSASIKGVAEHMTACVPLLEKHQAPEIAEAIRKALSGQP
ncbi:MAG: hypothetical protein LBJ59_11650, partial [Zoogloeaceae bacterium]|nr:hypothetical protein [Zoogloeaceae bacterium]